MSADAIRELIDKALTADEVEPAEAAASIVAQLRLENPRALRRYLDSQAERLIHLDLNALWRSIRSQHVAQGARSTFADAAESGDIERIGIFSTWYPVDQAATRKRLADMVGNTDVAFAAAAYEERAASNSMRAAFLRALQKKAGNRTVSEVMSEEQCQKLWDSITKAVGRAA